MDQIPVLSLQQSRKWGVIVEGDELIYADSVTLPGLLEMLPFTARCRRFTPLPIAQFEQRLEDLFHQSNEESRLIAQNMDQNIDLLTLTEEIPENEDLLDDASGAPVIRFINAILSEAVKEGASDIHIETYERTMSIRFRIDGVLNPVVKPTKKLAALVISRIKIMAKLDIAEKRVPQDGRISLRLGRRNIDVRVSTLPSQHGERVVLRLLDKNNLRLSLDKLGLSEHDARELQRLIHVPHGIILITGPTGSGKSTTLYAILSALNSPERNILTVEDPIEYELEGVGQTQVNTRVDMSFARGLRAILRQDPDVVMVGEIRDTETAQIAVQASLTGHLVLSTLHTNSASGAVTRLRDMGIEPFLLSSSLLGVVAQRLTRRLCPACKRQQPPTPQQTAILAAHQLYTDKLWQPVGCALCRQSGYQGRLAIHELMIVTPALRSAIYDNVDEHTIERNLRQQSRSLLENGLLCVIEGHTSMEEILRVTAESQPAEEAP